MTAHSKVIDKLFKDAALEIDKEHIEAAKKKVVVKIKELKAAKKMVANIERELTELKLEIAQDLE